MAVFTDLSFCGAGENFISNRRSERGMDILRQSMGFSDDNPAIPSILFGNLFGGIFNSLYTRQVE